MNRRQFLGTTAALAASASLLQPALAAELPLRPLAFVDASALPDLSVRQTVKMATDVGDLTIVVYPQAAPNAAERFLKLADSGFYDNTPIFRVIRGFVAQFGINWRDPHKAWKENNFDDDPSLFALDAGTLAFAKAGKNTNSTQVFINYGDNSRLARDGGFTTFAKVVANLEVASKFKSVGDPRMGLDQDRMWSNGEIYMKAIGVTPSMITKMSLVN